MFPCLRAEEIVCGRLNSVAILPAILDSIPFRNETEPKNILRLRRILSQIYYASIPKQSIALHMLMSDLTHRSLACKAHLNMPIQNALYKFITITISVERER